MGTEYFDSDRIRQYFGVTRLPTPLPPVRTSDFYPREYLGSGRNTPVLVTVDVDELGRVRHVEALPPPPRPPDVKIRAILIDSGSGEGQIREPARELDPLFARAAEASVSRMRFSPAEIEGQPVPFRGLRMTLVLSDPRSEPA